MKITSNLISAAMTLALGILFVILKAEVVGICITVLGVTFVVLAVLDLLRGAIIPGVVKILLGAAVLLIGWLLLDLALLVLGIVLLVYSILEIARTVEALVRNKNTRIIEIVLSLLQPAFSLIAAIFLITSRGAAIEWTVIIAGIMLIVNGVCAIVRAVVEK